MKFSWAWVWVALIWWYLPLPYVTLTDVISLDYKTVNDRLDGQREVTNKSIDSQLYLNYENLEWKNVYSLIDTWILNLLQKIEKLKFWEKIEKLIFLKRIILHLANIFHKKKRLCK